MKITVGGGLAPPLPRVSALYQASNWRRATAARCDMGHSWAATAWTAWHLRRLQSTSPASLSTPTRQILSPLPAAIGPPIQKHPGALVNLGSSIHLSPPEVCCNLLAYTEAETVTEVSPCLLIPAWTCQVPSRYPVASDPGDTNIYTYHKSARDSDGHICKSSSTLGAVFTDAYGALHCKTWATRKVIAQLQAPSEHRMRTKIPEQSRPRRLSYSTQYLA